MSLCHCNENENSHLRMADPALPRPEKAPNQNYERGGDCSYNKTLDLSGVSQKLHFDKYDGLISGRYAWFLSLALLLVMVIAYTIFCGDDKPRTYVNQHV